MIRKTSYFIFLSMLSLLFISSCKVGPNYVAPEVVSPHSYRVDFPSDDSIANMPWWEMFKDTVLQNIIKTTLSNNRDLRVAGLRIQESELQMGIVRSNLYPNLGYAVNQHFVATTDGREDFTYPTVSLSWEADLWGKFKRMNEAALQEYLATEQGYRSLTTELIAIVASDYLFLRDIDNRIAISEKMAEAWQSNLDIVNSRKKAGLVSGVNVEQAEIQLNEALISIKVNERLRTQTENSISMLMGLPPQNIPRGKELQNQLFPPQLPVGIPSEILSRRPDVLQVENSLKAQSERIGVAEALRYPSLVLSADMGSQILTVLPAIATLSAQLTGPLFNFKANKRRVEVEKNRTEQVLNEYEQTYLNALREVEDAMIAVVKYQQEYELRMRQMKSADIAVKLSWIRYKSGLTGYLEVLDLQRSQFNSYLEASKSLQLQLSSTVQLYKALGGGWLPSQDTISVN